jgi:heme-degrading monooxygenase HmoA
MFRSHPHLPVHAVALAVTAAVCTLGATAQPTTDSLAASGTPVVVIVKVAKPWYAPRSVVVSKMRDTIAQYESVPGLAYKAFSLARPDGDFGGIYFWKDSASAQAWFNPAWFERVERERGVKGEVRSFDAPVTIDNTANGAVASSDSEAVATLVTIATPAGVTRERLLAEFSAAAPAYQKVNGLMRKYFIIEGEGRFGGIYLWRDQAAAQQWFNEAWHARVRKTCGVDARIEWFDTPVLLPSKLASNNIAVLRP